MLTRVLPAYYFMWLSAGVLPKLPPNGQAFRRCLVLGNRPIVRLPFFCILLVVLYRQTGAGQLVDTVRDASICEVSFVWHEEKMCTPAPGSAHLLACLFQAACAASAASLLARLMRAETVSDASRRVLFDRWL